MILMGTQWIPHSKTEEWARVFLKVNQSPFPACIKKWQVYTSADGENGIKGINIIFTDQGKADEALVEISKIILPFWTIEGYRWKLEPLFGIKDSLRVLGK